MELLRQQEITDTNMHMEAVMVTEVNTVMETMDMAMVTVTAMAMVTVMEITVTMNWPTTQISRS